MAEVGNAIVRDVLPSYYWPQNAVVIVTDCGHRHIRPITMRPEIGAVFSCPFCESASQTPATETP